MWMLNLRVRELDPGGAQLRHHRVEVKVDLENYP
jgi:hypothetical protein